MNCVVRIFEGAWECDFERGFIVGAGVVLGTMLLLWLLDLLCKLMRRRRHCRFIELTGETGAVKLSAAAVAATVKLAAETLDNLEIEKVRIYRTRKGYEVDASATCELADNESAAEAAERFRNAVTAGLTDWLGVTEVTKVNLLLAKVKKQSSAHAPEPPEPPPALPEPRSGSDE